MDEFELIRRYFAAAACAHTNANVVLGIGDDCAILAPDPGQQLLVSTDTLVAGCHFPDPCDPYLLGQRALAVAASDLAAMGAEPLGFTLALSLPKADPAWLASFARGLGAMAACCDLRLVGGDTTCGALSLTVTVMGQTQAGQALLRSGAHPGELLCVGGCLGDAAGALSWVLGEQDGDCPPALWQHYWQPMPQLALGQALRGVASAAMDISDGLLADCGHLSQASGVNLQLQAAWVPRSPALLSALPEETSWECALSGGDDYVLLFTLPPERLVSLQVQGHRVYVVGWVQSGEGVQLHAPADGLICSPREGYLHFA